MTLFRLNEDEATLVNAFRSLSEEQRLLVLAAVLGTAADRARAELDNVIPLRQRDH
jgi:hypothetical protein